MKPDRLVFPVESVLPALKEAMRASFCCVLTAPPGAGKTTIVPPALLQEQWLSGKIIMLEPRRLAARRAADYMAAQRGERCGQTIGYRIRMESAVSESTCIEVVTEGILTRMLQTDMELPGVSVVIFDEYHERSIHADLGLAFALDVQKTIRPDLKILIMSATPDKEKLRLLLGDVPFIESEGKRFHVETHYLKHPSDKRLEVKTAEAIVRALRKEEGDILVFLPGKAEIKRTHQLLDETRLTDELLISELHGSASSAEQDAALQPAPIGRRKVILATSIAETSLTIEGVRVVIDSGVSRVSEFNIRRGMAGLVTKPVSRATADQRRGRAGRLREGVCYRLWTKQEETDHPVHTQPEILSSDLTPLALELAQWGTPRGEGLSFPDPPPDDMLSSALNTLYMLGATSKDGKLMPLGRRMCWLPVHPRLAAMMMKAVDFRLENEACLVAAILEEGERRQGRTAFDIQEDYGTLVNRNTAPRNHILDYAAKLQKLANVKAHSCKNIGVGFLLALAYPERVAKQQRENKYQLAQGMVVSVPAESKLNGEEYLVITDIDAAQTVGKAFRAAAIRKEDVLTLFDVILVREETVEWSDESVRGRRRIKHGALIIQEREFEPPDVLAVECILQAARGAGLSFFHMSVEDTGFIERSEWFRKYALIKSGNVPDEFPVLTEDNLLATMDTWFAPYLNGKRKKKDIDKLRVRDMVKTLFTYRQLTMLDALAPETIRVPGGSTIRIGYAEGEKPVVAVRLQEMFGQTDTPTIAGGRVPLLIHLMSPAHRPLAITQDLRSFWKNTYPEIQKQMRAKYPKHIWPDDPQTAIPTNKTKRAFNKSQEKK